MDTEDTGDDERVSSKTKTIGELAVQPDYRGSNGSIDRQNSKNNETKEDDVIFLDQPIYEIDDEDTVFDEIKIVNEEKDLDKHRKKICNPKVSNGLSKDDKKTEDPYITLEKPIKIDAQSISNGSTSNDNISDYRNGVHKLPIDRIDDLTDTNIEQSIKDDDTDGPSCIINDGFVEEPVLKKPKSNYIEKIEYRRRYGKRKITSCFEQVRDLGDRAGVPAVFMAFRNGKITGKGTDGMQDFCHDPIVIEKFKEYMNKPSSTTTSSESKSTNSYNRFPLPNDWIHLKGKEKRKLVHDIVKFDTDTTEKNIYWKKVAPKISRWWPPELDVTQLDNHWHHLDEIINSYIKVTGKEMEEKGTEIALTNQLKDCKRMDKNLSKKIKNSRIFECSTLAAQNVALSKQLLEKENKLKEMQTQLNGIKKNKDDLQPCETESKECENHELPKQTKTVKKQTMKQQTKSKDFKSKGNDYKKTKKETISTSPQITYEDTASTESIFERQTELISKASVSSTEHSKRYPRRSSFRKFYFYF